MKKLRKKREKGRRLIVFISSLIAFIAILGAILLQPSRPGESLITSGTLSLSSGKSATARFEYAGTPVNQSMTVGCKVPASLKLYAQSVTSKGPVDIYINDVLYATGTISGTGEVLLSSGCGCSTVCICEIRVGNNIIKVVSHGFEGQVKYEVYVKP